MPDIVIVGGGLAGWRTAENLRRHDVTGRITIVSNEEPGPYDRPPLSKQILSGKLTLDDISLAKGDAFDAADVTWVTDVAVSLDPEAKRVTLKSGESLVGDAIEIATGTRARRLPFAAMDHCHVVRTASDASTLRERLISLDAPSRVVIIGGGFIGAEVATAARQHGHDVIVLEGQVRPLEGVLGTTVATWLQPLAGTAGVDLRVNQLVRDVTRGDDGTFDIATEAGTMTADVVVVGAGALVNTEWLHASGLDVTNGVAVDKHLLAAPGIYAAGDVARFWYHGEQTRIEHWQIANDHATYIAQHLAGRTTEEFSTLAYFWSDQYGAKIQMLGHPHRDDEVELVNGSLEANKWVAHYRHDGELTGVIALNNPRELILSRNLFSA
jgi:NADPH-dependent 2,4-dienoyl-CoA reductase/sulfur reductase-like enzyme